MSNFVVANAAISFKAFEVSVAVINGELSIHDKIVEETVRELLDSIPVSEDWDDVRNDTIHTPEQCLFHIANVIGLEEFYPLMARATNVPVPSGKMNMEYAKNNLYYLVAAYADNAWNGEPWQYRLWVVYDSGRNCPEVVWHCVTTYAAAEERQDMTQHSAEKIFKRRMSDHHRR